MDRYKNRTLRQVVNGEIKKRSMDLIVEEPLSIRIQGKPYTVVMRTPGDEIPHVAGFCLGEGLVDDRDEFSAIGFCDEDVNVVTVTLSEARQSGVSELLSRKGFISQTSCGICGKEVIDDLKQYIAPLEKRELVDGEIALKCLLDLSEHQPLRKVTRASHAAALFDTSGRLLSVGEDVGRHNALDKAVGKLFLENRLVEAGLLVLSSRISYELVQKAARAKIPVIYAVSRPTSLAVELAESVGMTLACLGGDNSVYVFCGGQ